MAFLEGLFNVKLSGKVVDTFRFISTGGNHCQITNLSNVLFDGYILEGYNIWEQKVESTSEFCSTFADMGYEFELVR